MHPKRMLEKWRKITADRKIRNLLAADHELRSITFPHSKGWAFQAESFGGVENAFQNTEKTLSASQFEKIYVKNAHSYWIRAGSKNFPHLDIFVEKILPFQTKPFTLFSTDGDLTVPTDANPASIKAVLEHPNLLRWYSQNAIVKQGNVGKLQQIPIGLDLHTPRPDGIGFDLFKSYKSICNTTGSFDARQDRIFVDIHLNYSSDLRRSVSHIIKNNPAFYLLDERVSQLDLWRHYRAHKYVLSVIGNGLDCHRTWEALGLGCRVVTVTSPLDNLFKNFQVYIAGSVQELARTDFMSAVRSYFASKEPPRDDIKFEDFYKY